MSPCEPNSSGELKIMRTDFRVGRSVLYRSENLESEFAGGAT